MKNNQTEKKFNKKDDYHFNSSFEANPTKLELWKIY